MKKEVLIEAVQRRLAGGDVNTDISVKFEDIAVAANNSRASIIKKYALSGNIIDGQYSNTYTDYKIQYDSSRELLFIDLRTDIIDLDGQGGLRLISPLKDVKSAFVVVPENFETMYYNTIDYNIGRLYVWLEGRKIVFGECFKRDKWEGKSVLIKLVPDILDLEDEEEVKIPAELAREFMLMIIEELAPMKSVQEDQIPDNRDQT